MAHRFSSSGITFFIPRSQLNKKVVFVTTQQRETECGLYFSKYANVEAGISTFTKT